MVEKLISDFKRSKYRSVVVSFLVSIIFILVICTVVASLAALIALLMPFIGPVWTVFALGFCAFWFFTYNLLKARDEARNFFK